MIELLKEIGLTDSEAKVYLSLYELKEASVGPISKESGVSYSKVQILLDKLIEKGLCSYIVKQNTKYFHPADPSRLITYLNEKQERIEEQKKESAPFIEQLMAKMETITQSESVQLYEGFEGLKTVYLQGLDLLKKGDEVLVQGGSLGLYTNEKNYKTFFEQINRIRHEKGIAYRVLYNKDLRDNTGVKAWSRMKNTQVRFALEKTPASINIHANRVLIIYWTPTKPKVFLIESSIVADSFRIFFEALWSIGKK